MASFAGYQGEGAEPVSAFRRAVGFSMFIWLTINRRVTQTLLLEKAADQDLMVAESVS